jgi:hypothetical protein
MNIIERTDDELYELATVWWAKLIKYSNNKNYLMFIENFSRTLREGANEMEIGKQFARSDLAQNLSEEFDILGTIRRGDHVTVVIRQKHKKKEGEWLGRLVLGYEEDEVKIFSVSLF